MNDYESKQEERKQRYLELAESHRRKAEERYQSFHRISDMIPFGQPILVGHHSEGRHRADISRMDNHMRKAQEHLATAEYYKEKAAGIGKGGISSDDPEAIEKLELKVIKLEKDQEFMKKANKAIRMKDQDKGNTILLEMGFTQEQVADLRGPDFAGRVGFPSYMLSNNNANIRNVKQRIEQLRNRPTETTEKSYDIGVDVQIVHNTEINRVQIIFPDGNPGKEICGICKKHAFHYSGRNKAWQRQLNNNGIWYANKVIEEIEALKQEKTA